MTDTALKTATPREFVAAVQHSVDLFTSTLVRIRLFAMSITAYDVVDRLRGSVKIATITHDDATGSWQVTLELGQHRAEAASPGHRAFRSFNGATAYAEAWAWEVDGDV